MGGALLALLPVLLSGLPCRAQNGSYTNLTVTNNATVDGDMTVNRLFTAAENTVLGKSGTSKWMLSPSADNGGALFLTYNSYDYDLGIQFRHTGSTVDAAFNGRVSIGNVGCPTGLTCANTSLLKVGGSISAQGKVYVINYGAAWPDYVFRRGYRLRPLAEVGRYVQTFHHLPDVPSAAQVQANGLELAEMNAVLLKKVEELTLYLLQLQAANQALAERVAKLEATK